MLTRISIAACIPLSLLCSKSYGEEENGDGNFKKNMTRPLMVDPYVGLFSVPSLEFSESLSKEKVQILGQLTADSFSRLPSNGDVLTLLMTVRNYEDFKSIYAHAKEKFPNLTQLKVHIASFLTGSELSEVNDIQQNNSICSGGVTCIPLNSLTDAASESDYVDKYLRGKALDKRDWQASYSQSAREVISNWQLPFTTAELFTRQFPMPKYGFWDLFKVLNSISPAYEAYYRIFLQDLLDIKDMSILEFYNFSGAVSSSIVKEAFNHLSQYPAEIQSQVFARVAPGLPSIKSPLLKAITLTLCFLQTTPGEKSVVEQQFVDDLVSIFSRVGWDVGYERCKFFTQKILRESTPIGRARFLREIAEFVKDAREFNLEKLTFLLHECNKLEGDKNLAFLKSLHPLRPYLFDFSKNDSYEKLKNLYEAGGAEKIAEFASALQTELSQNPRDNRKKWLSLVLKNGSRQPFKESFRDADMALKIGCEGDSFIRSLIPLLANRENAQETLQEMNRLWGRIQKANDPIIDSETLNWTLESFFKAIPSEAITIENFETLVSHVLVAASKAKKFHLHLLGDGLEKLDEPVAFQTVLDLLDLFAVQTKGFDDYIHEVTKSIRDKYWGGLDKKHDSYQSLLDHVNNMIAFLVNHNTLFPWIGLNEPTKNVHAFCRKVVESLPEQEYTQASKDTMTVIFEGLGTEGKRKLILEVFVRLNGGEQNMANLVKIYDRIKGVSTAGLSELFGSFSWTFTPEHPMFGTLDNVLGLIDFGLQKGPIFCRVVSSFKSYYEFMQKNKSVTLDELKTRLTEMYDRAAPVWGKVSALTLYAVATNSGKEATEGEIEALGKLSGTLHQRSYSANDSLINLCNCLLDRDKTIANVLWLGDNYSQALFEGLPILFDHTHLKIEDCTFANLKAYILLFQTPLGKNAEWPLVRDYLSQDESEKSRDFAEIYAGTQTYLRDTFEWHHMNLLPKWYTKWYF